jgi:hypothetical protein
MGCDDSVSLGEHPCKCNFDGSSFHCCFQDPPIEALGIAAKVSVDRLEGCFSLRWGYIVTSYMGEVLIVPVEDHSHSSQNCRTFYNTVKALAWWTGRTARPMRSPYPIGCPVGSGIPIKLPSMPNPSVRPRTPPSGRPIQPASHSSRSSPPNAWQGRRRSMLRISGGPTRTDLRIQEPRPREIRR